jgi:hypothetical protein
MSKGNVKAGCALDLLADWVASAVTAPRHLPLPALLRASRTTEFCAVADLDAAVPAADRVTS